jgi:alpha-galactosidase
LLDGAWLAQAGLPTPRTRAETAYIVRLEKVRT